MKKRGVRRVPGMTSEVAEDTEVEGTVVAEEDTEAEEKTVDTTEEADMIGAVDTTEVAEEGTVVEEMTVDMTEEDAEEIAMTVEETGTTVVEARMIVMTVEEAVMTVVGIMIAMTVAGTTIAMTAEGERITRY